MNCLFHLFLSVLSSAKYSDKQGLQFLIFPEGLFYSREEDKCRTNNANIAFESIAEVKWLLQESKSRTPLKKLESAALVVPTGQSSNCLMEDLTMVADFDRPHKDYCRL